MNWTDRERRAVFKSVMNIRFQNCGEFLDSLRTCWLLQAHCAAWHYINRTVKTVRRQKAVPCRTDSSSLLLPDLQLCSYSQHSALQSAPLRHIKQMTLSVSRSYKHRPSSLRQSRAVTSPAFHSKVFRSTPVSSCRNRGAATVPTVFSEHASISHHISAFDLLCLYVCLLSVAVDSLYEQYGTVTVPLFGLTYCYTISTIYI